MKNIKLILLRHGQSTGNVDKTVYTQTPDHDIPLTELGQTQANAAALSLKEFLDKTEVQIIYSPFLRARQTAAIISRELSPSNIQEDPLIHEMYVVHSFKEMETVEDYEVDERYNFSPYWYKKGTSESFASAYNRARLFYRDLVSGYHPINDGSAVVVVSHGIFLTMLEAVINRTPVNDIVNSRWLKNCEYRSLDIEIN